jgi:hypothetical protein
MMQRYLDRPRTVPALIILLVLALASPTAKVMAQDTAPKVSITPALLQIPAGQTAEAAVQIDGVQDLYGFDVALKFDPNAVEVVAEDPANSQAPLAAGNFLEAGFVAINQADNAGGTARFVMTQLKPSQPKSGSGILAVVKLRGKKEGATTALTITKIDLARRDGTVFTATAVPGQVTVGAASQAVEAATPFPTQNSGIEMSTAAASDATSLMATGTPEVVTPVPVATYTPEAAAAAPTTVPAATTQPAGNGSNANDQSGILLGAGAMGVTVVVIAGVALFNLFNNLKRRRNGSVGGKDQRR